MKANLEPAKQVIKDFLAEIEELKKIRAAISAPMHATSFSIKDQMPEFDQNECMSDDYWEKEDAYIWLYAEAWDFRAFMHRPKLALPDYFQQSAFPAYLQWQDEEKDILYRGYIIPPPGESQALGDYLQELALMASEQNEHRSVWIKSLRSFLEFLRQDTDFDQQGAIESLFPYKMEFRPGYSFERVGEKVEKVERRYILRRVDDAVYPIDILTASDIIKNLAKTFLEGRPNSQRSAAEALGFAWLCHVVGACRLMTREEAVFATPITQLKIQEANPVGEYSIGIESFFGVIDIPISKTLYHFLLALPRDPTTDRIFSLPWRSLLRTFQEKGVKASKQACNLGNITFLTFMSAPHEAIGHRAFINKKLSPTMQSG
ncbi:hypothetical protein [Candidatus Protochlamydia phocaeensis]|uniref:hypothetical protein n=1 Tax=Candidatus Protochlamydia phocaeensis TaxID=1414722 RepID=UPI00083889FE|nr:hypothetical protein [Candidatus Protochlamydia phocaeensis]